MVHIYCGDGKGKTSAAVGLAVRAAGRGIPVIIARFLKTDDSGEVAALKDIQEITLIPCREEFGFVSAMDKETKERAAEYNRELFKEAVDTARSTLADVHDHGADNDLKCVLILDEIIPAVNCGMIPEEDLVNFLENRPEGLEAVLTGRDPSEKLLGTADYVSRIDKIAHPYDSGTAARRGIEY